MDVDDMVECWDTSEEPELRRAVNKPDWVEARRGSCAGDGNVDDEVREGSGGGTGRPPLSWVATSPPEAVEDWVSRRGRGGGLFRFGLGGTVGFT